MRKLFPLILCLCLLLTGCSDEEAEPTTQPAKRPQVSATVPTETIPETTVPEEAVLNTVVLRDQDVALRKSYVLIALSSDAPFLAQGVKLNETGANTLAQWIAMEDTRNTVVWKNSVKPFSPCLKRNLSTAERSKKPPPLPKPSGWLWNPILWTPV